MPLPHVVECSMSRWLVFQLDGSGFGILPITVRSADHSVGPMKLLPPLLESWLVAKVQPLPAPDVCAPNAMPLGLERKCPQAPTSSLASSLSPEKLAAVTSLMMTMD